MKALLVLTFLSFTVASQAQVKKGGLFGFGRNDESEFSSELFPNADAESAVPVESIEDAIKPPKESPSGFNIFKGGRPEKVDEVSYVIQDGERIETAAEEAVEEKKKGFFSFGKQKANEAAGEVIEAVPSTPAAPVAYQTPTVSNSDVALMSPEALAAINGEVEEADSKKGGFFGLFGKKKDSEPAPPSSVNVSGETTPQAAPEPVTVADLTPPAPAKPKPAPAPAPREVTPIPASAEAPEDPKPEAATVATNAPTPEFEGSSTPSTEEKKGGAAFSMNPINKLKPSKESKPVDFTGAETIIQNGEIVAPSTTMAVDSAVAETGSNAPRAPRQAPQVINGATTYSSWDDVEGTTRSAADKILRQMR